MRVGRPEPDQLSGEDNLRTYQEFEEIFWRGRHDVVNELRASLGLPSVDRPLLQTAPERGFTVLNAYSQAVVPAPGDWGPGNVFTGFWRLASQTRERLGESEPPTGLLDWLDAGPPPIFLGFGSMPILDPAPVLEMAVTAAQRAGVRILIGAGWTEMAEAAGGLPDYAHVVNAVDHDWLFPRCQAVVHHGGAGTTAAGLTAGRPTFIFSMFADQPFWGAQVTHLGVGGQRMFPELGLDTLTEALVLLGRDDVRANAAELGSRLRQEDGVATAIRTITDPARAIVPR
jgi:sterol 3beta-glucosyltransferase